MSNAELWGGFIGTLVTLSLGVGLFSWIKGLGFNYGFWFSIFLSPLIGAIVVAGTNAVTNNDDTDANLIANGQGRKCPFCAEVVKAEAIKCRHCGEDISSKASIGQIGSERNLPLFRVRGIRRDGQEVEKLIMAVNDDAARCIALASGIRVANIESESTETANTAQPQQSGARRFRVTGIRGNGTEVTKVIMASDETTAEQIAMNAGIYATQISCEPSDI